MYSYATQRVLRIPITSDGGEWLDPSTLRVQLTLTNTTNSPQSFSALDPMCFVHRMRIFMAGTLVEDVMYANRINQMLRLMSLPGTNSNDALEGFGVESTDFSHAANTANLFTLSPGKSITVSLRLNRISGVLSCGKDIPLRFAPVTVERALRRKSLHERG